MVRKKSIMQLSKEAEETITSETDGIILYKIPKQRMYKGYLYYVTTIVGEIVPGKYTKQREKKPLSKVEFERRKKIINNSKITKKSLIKQ
jgi:hypothetical protein